MRMNTLLHERHLLQAVQRGVITQAQAESLLNLARSEEGGAARMPDTGWLAIAQACVAAVVACAVCVANVDHPWRTSGAEEFVRSLGAAALLFGLAVGLRRLRTADAPASVLFAGAALQLLGVGHGLLRLDQPHSYGERGMVWGFALLVAAGLAMYRFMRVGPALLVAGFGALGLSVHAVKEVFHLHGYLRDGIALGLPGLALLGLGAWMDRAAKRSPIDGGFWVSLMAGATLAMAGAVLVDRQALSFFLPSLLIALLVGFEAVRQRRRVLLAGVGAALFALPPYAASEARLGDEAVAVGMLLGAVAVGVGAHFARRALFAQAAAGAAEDDRSVWC